MENLPAPVKLNDDDQRIALPDKNGLNFFEIKKIIRCQSDNSYTEFFILDDNNRRRGHIKIVVSKGFDYFEDFLIPKGFFYRVHNRHIVNVNHIKKYIKDKGDYLVMVNNSGEMIPVARARKKDFLNYLKSKGMVL